MEKYPMVIILTGDIWNILLIILGESDKCIDGAETFLAQ
jgi:hypothetical protein